MSISVSSACAQTLQASNLGLAMSHFMRFTFVATACSKIDGSGGSLCIFRLIKLRWRATLKQLLINAVLPKITPKGQIGWKVGDIGRQKTAALVSHWSSKKRNTTLKNWFFHIPVADPKQQTRGVHLLHGLFFRGVSVSRPPVTWGTLFTQWYSLEVLYHQNVGLKK